MDRIIRQITEHFVSQLPEGEEHYRIEELETYNFPTFLVRRIHIELQWNLDESMILPKTDWANTQSAAVQQSWQQFLHAIHAEVQLPSSYAKAVIETAVSDIVDMLIQPRKNIPDILFGGEDTLSASELSDRSDLLVVYVHFAQVLNSYMQRKNKEKLSRERCKEIIERIDKKVTNQYTPLQWAQMLDPIFTLIGPEIDSDLLRLFFEDRKMHRSARRFDMMDKMITRAEFIEVLSSPNLLNYDGYEDDQSNLFLGEEDDKEAELVSDEKEGSEPSDEFSRAKENDDEHSSKTDLDETDSEGEFETVEAKEAIEEPESDPERESEEEIEPKPDFEARPEKPADEFDELAAKSEENDNSNSLNDIFSNNDGQQQEENVAEEQPFSAAAVETETPAEEQAEGEDSPIWMRFMEPVDSEESSDPEDESVEQQDDDYADEPVIDLTDDGAEQEIEELEQRLADKESYFIDELFDGSYRAYSKALEEIARENTWKDASNLIRQNIFERNMVNIYSEAAVDFTDRLHDYFIKKENQN